jgi:cyanophycin synthetase
MQTLVWYHTVMLDFGVTLQLSLDKVAGHHLLSEAGIPTARFFEIDAFDPGQGAELLESNPDRSFVVKPARSTSGGEGVTCGVRTLDEFERARIWAWRWDTRLLVEEQGRGQEYRFLFLDGRLIDILRRDPPQVTGDGSSTVADLIRHENQRRADSGGQAGLTVLTIDLDCFLALRRAGLSLRSVPLAGQTVAVKSAANQSGASQNHTVRPEEVSVELIADAAAAARVMDLRFAGVDLMTPDPSRSLSATDGVVIEVNGTPGLHYHYLVSDPDGAIPVAVPLLEALLDSTRTRGFRGGF